MSVAQELAEPLDVKRVATLKARAALAGAVLVESTGDDDQPLLVLSKWATTRAFTVREIDVLDRTLVLMGAPA